MMMIESNRVRVNPCLATRSFQGGQDYQGLDPFSFSRKLSAGKMRP